MTRQQKKAQKAMERLKDFLGDTDAHAVRLRRSAAGIVMSIMASHAVHHDGHQPHIEPREVEQRVRRNGGVHSKPPQP